MHVTWRRNVQQQKARRKREPLVWFNSEARPPGTKPKWHYDRLKRVREFEERDRRAA